MKSISVGKIKDLEKEGWKISPSDINSINAQVRANQAAQQIVKSLEDIRDTIVTAVKMLPSDDISKLEALLESHHKTMQELFKNALFNQTVKTWEFDVKRTNKGFIDKVIANGR
jgi:galactokinase